MSCARRTENTSSIVRTSNHKCLSEMIWFTFVWSFFKAFYLLMTLTLHTPTYAEQNYNGLHTISMIVSISSNRFFEVVNAMWLMRDKIYDFLMDRAWKVIHYVDLVIFRSCLENLSFGFLLKFLLEFHQLFHQPDIVGK